MENNLELENKINNNLENKIENEQNRKVQNPNYQETGLFYFDIIANSIF